MKKTSEQIFYSVNDGVEKNKVWYSEDYVKNLDKLIQRILDWYGNTTRGDYRQWLGEWEKIKKCESDGNNDESSL